MTRTSPPISGALKFRVAGVSFAPDYPGNLLGLRRPAEQAWASGECLAAVLIRNADNVHDANAVEVHVPSGPGMVGHLPRDLAARAAPKIDAGARFAAEVVGVAFDDTHPDRPGLEVRVWEVAADQEADQVGAP